MIVRNEHLDVAQSLADPDLKEMHVRLISKQRAEPFSRTLQGFECINGCSETWASSKNWASVGADVHIITAVE